MTSQTISDFDNMVGHIVSINDERDVVPLLLGLREMWPKIRDEIELMTEALEIIAGRRQCIDNLMGNVDVACAALDRKP